MKILACVLLAALLAWSAPVAADFTYETTLAFTITQPPGTTATGFTLTYNTSTINNLHLLTGSATTFGTNGVSAVSATFPATTADAFTWTFTTPDNFPVRNLNFDFTGASAPITGGIVAIDVEPVPEPRAVTLFGIGVVIAWWRMGWFRRRRGYL